jgi:hypothetical protein
MRVSLLVIHRDARSAQTEGATPTQLSAAPSSVFMKSAPRADKRGFDLISEALPFGRLWYCKPDEAIGYAKFYSRSHTVVVRVFNESGALIATHESDGVFREL